MKERTLISVIVPVYKVKDYLDECVKSILCQTYANIEVILVDDGSPDDCPRMCDDWAKKDGRVKVVHKKNGGLSSARNAGLDVASGEFICFVDSDDFICEDAIQSLYTRIEEDETVGIVSGMIYRYQDGETSVFHAKWNIKNEKVIPSDNFLLETMSQRTSYTVWNKLYRKLVIGGTRFREGRNNEDTLFMYDLGKNMSQQNLSMVEIPHYVYFYRYREDSICTTTKTPLAIDIVRNLEDIMADCKMTDKPLYLIVYRKYTDSLFFFLESLLFNTVWCTLYFQQYQKKLRMVPFKYIFSEYKINEVLYIELLKHAPSLRRILKQLIKKVKGKS